MSGPGHDTAAERWPAAEVASLFALPFTELLFRAQAVHRRHFDPTQVELATLVSVKTGACPEDCAYCPQSVRFHTEVEPHPLMPLEEVREAAQRARAAGAARLCLGAAWRGPKPRDVQPLIAMVQAVRAEGLQACLSAGLLSAEQAQALADAGLDYYNHNLDTSPGFYPQIITTRTYADRLRTLAHVRDAGIGVCCGGIVGMGETREDRVELLRTLANLPEPPESVPLNQLIPVPGTPLADVEPLDPLELVRTVAVARIAMPMSMVRLSAGRESMSEATQALCFLAGANSIFTGDKLLTAPNAGDDSDGALLAKLGMTALRGEEPARRLGQKEPAE